VNRRVMIGSLGMRALSASQIFYRRKNSLVSITSLVRVQTGRTSNTFVLGARRFEPSSRTFLIGEQPNPWELLHPQDKMSRHRGAEHRRRYERLGGTSLLSPG